MSNSIRTAGGFFLGAATDAAGLKGQRNRRIGLSVAAALLAGTAMVPAAAQTFDIGGGSLAVADFAGPPLNNPTVITNGQLNITTGVDLPAFGGNLNDSLGVFSLSKFGAGSITLTGAANTYSGPTQVVEGSLIIGAGSSIGTGNLTLFGGTTLAIGELGGAVMVLPNQIFVANPSTIDLRGGSFEVDAAGAMTFDGSDLTLNGTIIGPGGNLRVINSGRITINGNNAHATTTLEGVIAQIGSDTALGVGTVNINEAAVLNNSGATRTLANSFAVENALFIGGNNNIILNGALSNAGGGGFLYKVGPGDLRLNGDNLALGSVRLASGNLIIGHANALGAGTMSTENQPALTRALVAGVDNLTIINGISVVTSPMTIDTGTFTLALTGQLTGDALVTKIGTGTLVLSGNSTKTGGFTVNNGIAVAGSNTAFGVGTLTLANGTTLGNSVSGLVIGNAVSLGNATVDTGANTFTLGGVVSGAGILTKTGSGTLVLTGANTYAGGTSLNDGTIRLGHATGLGTGALAMAGNTTLASGVAVTASNAISIAGGVTFDTVGGALALGGVISGSGGFIKAGAANTLTLSGANTFLGNVALNAGGLVAGNNAALGNAANQLQMANATSFTLNSGITVANAISTTTAANISLASGTGTLSGPITGNALVTLAGAGGLTLSGANGYSGGTNVASGTIVVGNNTAFGTGAVTMADGTALGVTGGGFNVTNGISIGNVTVDTGANAFTLSGVVSGAGQLTKLGSGALTLSGANSYAGGTALNAGSITVGDNLALGTGSLAMADTTMLTFGANSLVLTNAITTAGVATINTAQPGSTLTGAISGAGSIVKSGTGLLQLEGANSYAGGTALNAGTIVVTNSSALSTGTVAMANSTTLRAGAAGLSLANAITTAGVATIDTLSNTFTLGGLISGAGSIAKSGDGTLVLNGANTYAGGTALNAGTIQIGQAGALGGGMLTMAGSTELNAGTDGLTVANAISTAGVGTINTGANTLTLGGVISGAGSISKTGSGTLILNGANSYAGGTTINGGTVGIGSDAAFGTGTVTVAASATLAPQGVIQTTRTLTNAFVLNADTVVNGTGTGVFTPPLSFSGNVLQLDGNVSGAGNLQVVNGGALALFGNNSSYTGNIAVGDGTVAGAGRLRFNSADSLGSGAITLNRYSIMGNFAAGTVTIANNINVDGNGFEIAAITGSTAVSGIIINGNIIGFGVGSLNKTGSNTVTLNGTNNYNQLFLDGGGVVMGNNTALGNGQLVNTEFGGSATLTAGAADLVFANNVLNLKTLAVDTDGNTLTLNGVISAAGGLVKVGAGTLILGGENTYIGGTALNAGAIQVATSTALGNNTVGIANGTTLRAGAADLSLANAITTAGVGTIDTQGFTFTLGGLISGAGSIAKSGAGTLVLNGANTYAGGTALNAGTIRIGTDTGLGTGTLTMAGTTTLATGAAVTAANAIAIAGGVTFDTALGALALNGVVSGTDGFTKIGNNGLTLGGANTFTGNVVLNAGSLAAGNNAALGNAANQLQMANGTALILLNGITVANAISTTTAATITQAAGTGTVSGVISGDALVTLNGGAGLILSGNNTYTGGSSVNGIVTFGNANAFGTGTVTVNNATLSAGGAFTLANAIALNGGGTVQTNDQATQLDGVVSGTGGLTVLTTAGGPFGQPLTLANAGNSFTGGLTIGANAQVRVTSDGALGDVAGSITNNDGLLSMGGTFTSARAVTLGPDFGQFNVDGGQTVTLTGLITGGAGSDLRKDGAGTLIIGNGGNSFADGARVFGGELRLSASNALGNPGGLVQLFNTSTLGASGDVTIGNNVQIEAGATATIDSGAGTFILNGVLSGSDDFFKTGTGILRLTGTNTYSGVVQLTDGELDVDGSLAGGINANGGRVTGVGSVAGPATIVGGRLAPGNSPGTLAFGGNLTISGGTNLDFELAGIGAVPGVDADLITVGGNLNIDGAVLNIIALPGFDVGIGNRTLFTYAGNLLNFSNVTISNPNPPDVTYSLLPVPGMGPFPIAGPGIIQLNVAFTGVYRWDGTDAPVNGVIGGGSGVFNLVNTNFTNSNGTFNLAYGNNATDDLEFGGAAAGTVDVASAGINFDQMGFVTTGYTLAGAGSFNANNSAINLGANDATISTTITGGPLAKNGTGNLTLSGTNTFSSFAVNAGTVTAASDAALGAGTATFAGGTFLVASGTPRTLANAIVINAAGGLTVDAATNTLALNGAISGTGPLNLTSSGGAIGGRDGVTTLAGVNSYTGGTTVTGTTAIINADSGLGNAAGSVTLDNAELRTTATITTGRAIALNGAVANTINTDAGTVLTANGVVSGTSALQKIGTGTLVLGNAGNSYAGGTVINAGTVSVASNGALGALAGGVNFTGNSTLQFTADVTSARTVAIDGGATGTIDTVANDVRLDGVISGLGALTKVGDGRLTLTGTNIYQGGTNLNAGTLRIDDGNAIGSGLLTTQGGTTFVAGLAPGAGTITLANNITLAGGQTTIDLVGNLLIINPVTGAVSTNGTNLVLNGTITGAGGFTTSNATAGQIVINGNNSFTGDVNLNSAVVVLNNDNALGTGNTVNINQAAGIRNTTGGTTRTIASNIAINDPNATVGGNGNLVLTGVVSGADVNVFNKVGLGTVTLANAANTISSQIEVAQGELAVTGTLTQANQLTTVRSGATLSGTGTINGIVDVVNGGVLSAGVGGNGQVGLLTIGTLLLNEQSSLVFDLGDAYRNGGPENDQIAVTNLRLGGRLTVRESAGANTFGIGVYNLFTYQGALMAGSTGVEVQTLPGAFAGVVQTLVPGQVNLVVTQPGTFLQYWDGADATGNGAIDGGNGTWSATGSNWTGLNGGVPDSQLNTSWFNNSVAVFGGTAGTVTLNAAPAQAFNAQGLQFVTTGYTLTGGRLEILNTGVDTGTFVSTGAGITATIDSTIQGAGILFKQGDGTLVLGGSNGTFSGGTRVQGGTLQLNTANAAGTGSIALLGALGTTLSNGGVLTVANAITTTGSNTVNTAAGNFTLSGVISGAGSIVKDGANTLTLSGNNSYVGGTTVANGTVAVTNNNSIGTGVLTINGGATFQAAADGLSFANLVTLNGLGTVDTQANGLTLSGIISDGGVAGTLVKIGSGNLNLQSANTYSNGTNLNGGSITVFNNASLGAGALAMAGGTSLIAGADGLSLANAISTAGVGTVATGANTLTLGGVISGAGSISKTGTGTLVLNGANGYAGGTALTAGAITVGTSTALGTGGLVMTGGTTLNAGAADLALANAVTTNGVGTVNTNAFTFTLNGVVDGAGSITKVGSGNLVLNGANSYAGGTALNAGTITVGTSNALGTGGLTAAGGTNLVAGVTGLNAANAVTLNGGLTVDSSTGSFELSGVVGGAGSITKINSGNLILSGVNTYTGGTNLNAGSLTITNNGSIGTGTLTTTGGTTVLAGRNDPSTNLVLNLANAVSLGAGTTTIDLQGSSTVTIGATGLLGFNGANLTLGGAISGAGGLSITDGGRINFNGNNSFAGGVTVDNALVFVGTDTALGLGAFTANASTTGLGNDSGALRTLANAMVVNSNLIVTGPNDITLTGAMSGGGNLLKGSDSTLTLNGASTRTGDNNLFAGRITLGNSGALGNGSLVVFSAGLTTTLAAGTDGLTVANGVSVGAGANLVVESGAGTFTLNGLVSGQGALTKVQSGTLVLNGANNYQGGTSLNVGTIQIGNNTALGASTLSMANGTTLQAGINNLAVANFIGITGNGTIDTQGFTYTQNGVIFGAGATLTKIGSGNLVLNGTNAFTDGAFINAGTVTVGNNAAFGNTGLVTMANGTVLANNNTGFVVANAFSIGNVEVATGANTFTMSGVVNGAGLLTKTGSGNLILNGANGYTGGTALTAGTITVGTSTALGTGGLVMTGGTTLNAGAADLALANAVTTNGVGTVNTNAFTFTLNGVVDGAGSITKIGSGNLVLNGANTYTGGSSINAGTVTVGNNTALGTSAVTMANGTVLTNNTNNLVVANAFSIGNVEVATGANTFTMNGVVNGAGLLTKTGSGNLILNGANGYTGGTALTAGTITVGTSTALGTGGLVMTGGTTLNAGAADLALANAVTTNGVGTVNTNAFTFTLNGVVDGAGSITKIGTGTLVLNGANTYTGGTALNVGTIQVGNNTALGTNTLAMAGGTTLQAGVAGLTVANNITTAGVGTIDTQGFTFTSNGVISGAGSITKIGAGNLVLNGANTYTGGSSINAGTVTVGNNTAFGTNTVTMANGTVLTNNTNNLVVANAFSIGNVEVATGANTFTMSGVVNGAGLLTKTGSGNLILTGNNGYTGGTALTNGTITFNTNTAFGTGTVTTTGGTSLIAGVNDPSTNQVLTLANAISLGAGTTNLDLQGSAFSAPNAGGVDVNGTTLTLNGVISGDGGLNVFDNGRLNLNGANSYAGGTTVTSSAVYVGTDTAFGSGTVTSNFMALGNDSGALRTLANAFTLNSLMVVTGPNNITLDGVIGGASGLVKTSTSTLTLNAANSFGGTTTLVGGRITVGNNLALSAGQLAVFNDVNPTTLAAGTTGLALANSIAVGAAGNLIVESGAGSFTLNGVVSGGGALTKIQAGTLVLNGANTYSGGTSLNVGTIQVGSNTALGTAGLVMADSTTLQAGVDGLTLANTITTNGLGVVDTQGFGFTLNGVIDGTGSISKNGTGTLVLNGANSYTGGSFINAGGVTVGNNTALGTSAVVMLDGTTLTAGVDGLALANEFNIGNVTVATGGFGFTLNGPIGGTGLLTKTGSGTLTLNGSNVYGGGTALTAGTITIGSNTALGTGTLTMSDATSLVAFTSLTVANNIATLGVGTIDNVDALTLTGVISGAGSITKTNQGNLILNGLNSYAGGTALNLGTITVATDTALGTGTLTMAGGTTLTSAVNVGRAVNTENVVLGNAITGTGTFATGTDLALILAGTISGTSYTKTGNGLLVLNGSNSFAGGFTLAAGTLRTGSNGALGTGALTTADGTTLQNGVAGVTLANDIAVGGALTIDTQAFGYTLNGVISGTGPITKIGSANLTLGGVNTFSGGFNLNAGGLTLTSSSALGTGTFTAGAGTSLAAGADLTLANAIALGGAFTLDTAANTVTLNGVVSGTGPLGKAGSGTLVLNGVNTYTGGTALNAGTITVTNNASLGTGALAMAGGTTLTSLVNSAASSNVQNIALANAISTAGVATINTATPRTIILDGVISGAGSIAKTGAGLLVLNAANTYAGGTAFNAGTIRTGNSAALGTGAVTAAAGTILQAGNAGVTLGNAIAMAGGMTVDVNGRVYGLGGVISGTGPLNVIDSAAVAGDALVLSGTNTYTGGTVVTGTTVSVSRDANLGNAAGSITLNGAALRTTASFSTARNITLGAGGGSLLVDVGTTLTMTGVISGGALTKNSGELVLAGASTYTGGTSLNAGTITVANNAALGTGALAMAGGTTLNTAVNAGTTSNTQNVALANNISTAGAGTINAGTGLTLILDGTISGAGSLNKTGAGLAVLNNQNFYAGGTTISAGTLRVGNGSALGTGAVTTVAGSTLQAGNPGLTLANAIALGAGNTTVDTQAFTTTLSGVLSGAGGITKAGTGTLNLSAASTYTGATTVAAGTLNLTGSLASVVTVNSGATLAGTFAVGGLNVAAGGIITPGAPGSTGITTITIPGAVSLNGTYTVNVTPTANDRITAGGALSLGGTLAVVPAVPATFSQFNQTFTVASGATRTGTFATVTGLDQFGVAFNPVVEYTTTAANIRLAPQSLATLGNRFGGVSGNQLEVANAFDRAVAGGYNPQAFFNVYAGGGSALPATLRQMSGEQRATERRVVLDASRTVRESALDRLNGSLASMGGQQVKTSDGDRTLTFWLRGAGSWSKAQTNGAATGFTTEQRGILTGLDYAKGAFTVGGMFNYTSTDIEYRVLGGSSTVETVGGTVYAGYRGDGGIVANVGASVAGARTSGARAITLTGFSQSLAGVTTGTSYQVFGELAWDLAGSADTRIEPFARLSHVRADMGGLTETGGVAALNAAAQGYDITVTNLGMRFGANVAGGKVSLNASASWQGTSGDRDAATVLGIQAVGQTGLIRSVLIDRDALNMQLDAGVNLSDTIRFSLGYSGLIGKRNDDHGGRATLNFAF